MAPHFSFSRGTHVLVLGALQRSEFDVQAELFSDLRSAGFNVRGEVRGTVSGKKTGQRLGNKVRLDLVIFEGRSPRLVIEVKMKRSQAWRQQYQAGPQFSMYGLLGLPVVIVCGEHEAKLLLTRLDWAMGLPPGVHWLSSSPSTAHQEAVQ